MIKVFTVIGARPQFIKAATVSRIISQTEGISEIIVHTGQHFDPNMSEVFFTEMEIPTPDYHLEIHGLNHGAMTGRMMEGLEGLMLREKPDIVLIYGDTNSTLAGALTASKLHIKVAHVEAGLRSFNMHMPEEINRILADRISDVLYCPTQTAIENLKREGYDHFDSRMLMCGDVMYDAALYYADKSANKSQILENLKLDNYILCTMHRAENTDDSGNLRSICNALNSIHRNIPVVLPLHPRTKKMLKENDIELNVRIIEPVGYFDMIALIDNAKLILTDSGGLQKEAYFFKKPCVTIREQTEWLELISSGANILTGADENRIIEAVGSMMSKEVSFNDKLYGDGNAARIIVSDIKEGYQ